MAWKVTDACIERSLLRDDLAAMAMVRGSEALLKAVNRARGVVTARTIRPVQERPKVAPQLEPAPVATSGGKSEGKLWPNWYNPPGHMAFFPREVIRKVGALFGYSVEEMLGDGRACDRIDARAAVVAILRHRGLSYPEIGRHLGERDHSSVLHLHKRLAVYERRNSMVSEAILRFSRG